MTSSRPSAVRMQRVAFRLKRTMLRGARARAYADVKVWLGEMLPVYAEESQLI